MSEQGNNVSKKMKGPKKAGDDSKNNRIEKLNNNTETGLCHETGKRLMENK